MQRATQRPRGRRRAWERRRPGLIVALVIAGLTGLAAQARADLNDAAIVIDASTGAMLYGQSPDALRFPASLTKMMTLYLLFGEMERGAVHPDTKFLVSAHAASQAPSKLYLRAGTTITAEQALLALVTRSANDAATVIAENLAGTEEAFARQMTDVARAIGMSRSTFRNANGLPNSEQVTTARDMANLGIALQTRFPQYYSYFENPVLVWQGQTIYSHNHLLQDRGVDGIKTGYTNASGFNLVTSVHRDDRAIVAVVMGGATAGSRDARMRELIASYLPDAVISTGTMVASVMDPPLPRANPSGLAGSSTVIRLALSDTAVPEANDLGVAQGDGDSGELVPVRHPLRRPLVPDDTGFGEWPDAAVAEVAAAPGDPCPLHGHVDLSAEAVLCPAG